MRLIRMLKSNKLAILSVVLPLFFCSTVIIGHSIYSISDQILMILAIFSYISLPLGLIIAIFILRRSFKATRFGKRLALAGLCLSSLIILLFSMFLLRVQIPRNVKLADLQQEITISFIIPKGEMFDLVLDISGVLHRWDQPPPFKLNGSCRIETGGINKEFQFSEQTINDCNWLHEKSEGSSYILTRNSIKNAGFDTVELMAQLKPCKITLTLEQGQFLEGASIWLTWLQRWKDYPKTDRSKSAEIDRMKLLSFPEKVDTTKSWY